MLFTTILYDNNETMEKKKKKKKTAIKKSISGQAGRPCHSPRFILKFPPVIILSRVLIKRDGSAVLPGSAQNNVCVRFIIVYRSVDKEYTVADLQIGT